MELPEARVIIHTMGRDGEPLVVIDGVSGRADELREAGYAAAYQTCGEFYPGLRTVADAAYLNPRTELLKEIALKVFGFQQIRLAASVYSLLTKQEHELAENQCIAHFDTSGPAIAMITYLLGPESGGTAFYRHRRTGFEAITPDREAAYRAGLIEDNREYGPPPQRYYYGNSDRFDLIAEVEARPDRLVLYRARQLHGGVIPKPPGPDLNLREARLTIVSMLTDW
jgi:hypothetical protein